MKSVKYYYFTILTIYFVYFLFLQNDVYDYTVLNIGRHLVALPRKLANYTKYLSGDADYTETPITNSEQKDATISLGIKRCKSEQILNTSTSDLICRLKNLKNHNYSKDHTTRDIQIERRSANDSDKFTKKKIRKHHYIGDVNRSEPLLEIPSNAPSCSNRTYIVVIIHCATYDTSMRAAIRQNWGSQRWVSGYQVQFYFMVGWRPDNATMNELFGEMKRYNDIILGNFIDSYRNLSLKSISMLEWVSHNCASTKYILKADDDTFVNMTKLIRSLKHQEMIGHNNAIYGYLFPHRSPHRNITNEYYVPRKLWPQKVWPPCVIGPAYVISTSVARDLYTIATRPTIPFITMEDILITGIVRQKAKVAVYDLPTMRHRGPGCFNATMMSYHNVYERQHQILWRKKMRACRLRGKQNGNRTRVGKSSRLFPYN